MCRSSFSPTLTVHHCRQISLELDSVFTFLPHPSAIKGRVLFPSSLPRNDAHFIIKFTDGAQKGKRPSPFPSARDVSSQAPLLKEIRFVLRAECLTVTLLLFAVAAWTCKSLKFPLCLFFWGNYVFAQCCFCESFPIQWLLDVMTIVKYRVFHTSMDIYEAKT